MNSRIIYPTDDGVAIIVPAPEWLAQEGNTMAPKKKKVTGLIKLQIPAGAANPALKGVPAIIDLAKTDEQRALIRFLYAGQAIGRPFVAPPGLAPERVKMLRGAFDAAMADPQFREEAKKLRLDVDPVSGADLEKTIRDIYATPAAVVKRVGELIK